MKISTIILFCLLTGALFAQNYSLSGTVTDKEYNPLAGAHISVENVLGESLNKNTISADNGRFKFDNLPNGNYQIVVQFLGFADTQLEAEIVDRNNFIGAIPLKDAVLNIDGVEVTETMIIATQNGDTTSYNAGAFKTMPDASAEDLVEKMPGVVLQNGKVEAQGEDVKEVQVDGRPFFGNDPTAALRNLPAEVVDKIQVFDKKSDQSNFTGFDDGETSKTINIVTKKNMRSGQFGKAYTGYGYENKYKAGGNISFFNGDQRLSIIGQSNNVNIQNFSSEDLLGVTGSSGRRGRGRGGRGGGNSGSSANDFLVGQTSGIVQAHALGLNYADRWGKKMDVSGSYFFNNIQNTSEEDIHRVYVDTEGGNEFYTEENDSETDDFNHRINMRLEYKIDSLNSLIMRPRLSVQINEGLSETFGATSQGIELLNATDNHSLADLSGLNFSNSLLWRHKFMKPRRTFSMNINGAFNNKVGENTFGANTDYFIPIEKQEYIDQIARLDSDSRNIGTSLSFTEPLNETQQLLLNYRANWKKERANQETYDLEQATENYTLLNENLTNTSENQYITQSVSAGWNYKKEAWTLMARLAVQQAQLQSEELFPLETSLHRTYYNVLPFVMLRYRKSRQNQFRLMYRTSTDSPSVTQLQNVVDNSNPIQLSVGNPTLDQSVQHRIFARFQNTNTEKSTVFFFMLGGSVVDNYISNSTYLSRSTAPIFEEYEVERGAQISQPVNLDGYYDLRSFLTYGMPLNKIKSNLNVNLSGNYSHTPSWIEEQSNFSNNKTAGVGLVLSSNISEQVDFTIASQSNFSEVKNSLQSSLDTRFFNQSSKIKLDWIFARSFIYRTNLTHQLYDGLFSKTTSYWLWNMSLGKKMFKNNLGEISISVYDILNQNQNLTRNVTDTYYEDVETQVLQRYFMLNFIYNFRNFNSGKASTWEQERKKRDHGRGWY